MNSAIEESWKDYQDASIGMDENEQWAHEHGWKNGAEWIRCGRYCKTFKNI